MRRRSRRRRGRSRKRSPVGHWLYVAVSSEPELLTTSCLLTTTSSSSSVSRDEALQPHSSAPALLCAAPPDSIRSATWARRPRRNNNQWIPTGRRLVLCPGRRTQLTPTDQPHCAPPPRARLQLQQQSLRPRLRSHTGAALGRLRPGIYSRHTRDRATLLNLGSQGYVSSYNGAELRRYTSFRAHNSVQQPERVVRQLLFNERGVVSLAARGLHMSTRGGPAMWNLQ